MDIARELGASATHPVLSHKLEPSQIFIHSQLLNDIKWMATEMARIVEAINGLPEDVRAEMGFTEPVTSDDLLENYQLVVDKALADPEHWPLLMGVSRSVDAEIEKRCKFLL